MNRSKILPTVETCQLAVWAYLLCNKQEEAVEALRTLSSRMVSQEKEKLFAFRKTDKNLSGIGIPQSTFNGMNLRDTMGLDVDIRVDKESTQEILESEDGYTLDKMMRLGVSTLDEVMIGKAMYTFASIVDSGVPHNIGQSSWAARLQLNYEENNSFL